MVQGWVESMHMPMSEIEAKFRRSEMFLLGWRSSEVAASMSQLSKPAPPASQVTKIEGVPSEFETDGEPDISKMTGAQALKLMQAAGISIAAPMPTPQPRPRDAS